MFSIGIDLGTTNSVAAHVEGGRAVVIPNRHDEPLTPSVVSRRLKPEGGHELLGGDRGGPRGLLRPARHDLLSQAAHGAKL